MNNIKTKGIILNSIDYKDADKLLTIYTYDLGKILVRAKGIRKIASKNRGHLDILTESQIELLDYSGFMLLTTATTIKFFGNIKSSSLSVNKAFFVLEVFNKITPENEQNILLYNFLNLTLDFIDKDCNYLIINAFLVKILKIQGFITLNDITSNAKLNDYIKFFANNTYKTIYENIQKIPNEANNKIFLKLVELAEETLETKISSLKYL